MFGFAIQERMEGEGWLDFGSIELNRGTDPIYFDVVWGTKSIANLLYNAYKNNGNMEFCLKGYINFGPVTYGRELPCEGHLTINYLQGFIQYVIIFTQNGKEYRYLGEKVNIKLWNLLTSHTTCFGIVTDSCGQLFHRSVTHFRLSSIPKFISSFKIII